MITDLVVFVTLISSGASNDGCQMVIRIDGNCVCGTVSVFGDETP